MRDLSKETAEAFSGHWHGTDSKKCVEMLDTALNFIFKDQTITSHDKVAGDFDFEELIAVLMLARDLLRQLDE